MRKKFGKAFTLVFTILLSLNFITLMGYGMNISQFTGGERFEEGFKNPYEKPYAGVGILEFNPKNGESFQIAYVI
ncbi:MAG: hypothetical protein ACTSWV_00105, partial [Candidatus Asgardarchaeia archaeon]